MGWRFYKSIKLLPGVRLNISKSGFSTTLGTRGASANLGRRGRRVTLGLPGTGISYVRQRQWRGRPVRRTAGGLSVLALAVFVFLLLIGR